MKNLHIILNIINILLDTRSMKSIELKLTE